MVGARSTTASNSAAAASLVGARGRTRGRASSRIEAFRGPASASRGAERHDGGVVRVAGLEQCRAPPGEVVEDEDLSLFLHATRAAV